MFYLTFLLRVLVLCGINFLPQKILSCMTVMLLLNFSSSCLSAFVAIIFLPQRHKGAKLYDGVCFIYLSSSCLSAFVAIIFCHKPKSR
jgi:hypothetical protein